MTAISSTWKPENDLLFCDGHHVLMRMGDQVVTGEGFLSAFQWHAHSDVQEIADFSGITHAYRSMSPSMEIRSSIKLTNTAKFSRSDKNLVELLTKQLSEFDLIKEVNRRFKEEN